VYLNSFSGVQTGIISKFKTATNDREYKLEISNTDKFRFAVSSNGLIGGVVTTEALDVGLPALNTWYLVIGWHDSVNDQIGIQINDNRAHLVPHALGVFNGTGPHTV
jgi:hypothetical protein